MICFFCQFFSKQKTKVLNKKIYRSPCRIIHTMVYNKRLGITFDIPIVQESLYDYDDMNGVVDDKINPPDNESYTPTLSLIEILGGKCTICKINYEKLLTIHYIHDYEANENPTQVKRLIEETIRRGGNPKKDFRALCYNCKMAMKEIKKSRKSTGLTELNEDELDQELRKIYS